MVEAAHTFASQVNASNVDTFFGVKGANELHESANNNIPLAQYIPFASSSHRSLTLQRVWDQTSQEVLHLNDQSSNTRLIPGAPTFFDTLKSIKVICQDSASGGSQLGTLARDTIDWQKCQLEMTDSTDLVQSYNIENLILGASKSGLTKTQHLQLATFLRYLATGDLSQAKTQALIDSGDLAKAVAPVLTKSSAEILGAGLTTGTPNTVYEGYSPVNNQVLGLLFPNEEALPSASFDLETTCQTLAPQGDPTTICSHIVTGDSRVYQVKTVHNTGSTEIVSNPQTTDAWTQALGQQGLYSSSSSYQEGPAKSTTVYHSLTARLPGVSLPKVPSPSEMAYNLLIPLGLCISAAGLLFAKSNYEETKKPTIRRVVGCVTGLAAAILGVTLSSIPFGTFDT